MKTSKTAMRVKLLRRPKRSAERISADLSEAIDALAQHAVRRSESASPAVKSQGVGHILTGRLRRPLRGAIVIAVADDDTVAIRTIKRAVAGRSREVLARDLATRIAEIEAALEEFEPRMRAPLTAEEAKVLVRGGAKVVAQGTTLEEDTRVRAAAAYSGLLRESYSTAEAANLLDVNTSRIRQRLSSQPPTLYGIRRGREWRIPKFQFSGKQLITGIDEVIGELPATLHPVAVHNWFTLRNTDLYDDSEDLSFSPLEWLRAGRSPKPVAELAAGL